MTGNHLYRLPLFLTANLLLLALLPVQTGTLPIQPVSPLQPGCTVFYGFDGQTALGANNEDFNDPFTFVWFIPASPGRFGRVYFGYDDGLPQGGLNDQGVFFDGLSLPYKAMPVTSAKPPFPGGALNYTDEVLSRSANVKDVIDITGRWQRLAGEYGQQLYGDRFGDSVIIDGDTILRKQGSFQLATNFRLVDNPNPPYPEQRYGSVYNMLSRAKHFTVELFRQALDAAHAEGDYPTLYSQVYELKTGIIHLYQYHDFQHEVVLNLAAELAKGAHVVPISSLFPSNDNLERWTIRQDQKWKASYEGNINYKINPGSQNWMSGQYLLPQEADISSKVYLEDGQLTLQKPNQNPIALYPLTSKTVFHHFFNGMDLTLTFQRNVWGQVSGAQGRFSFKPYGISLPYALTQPGVVSFTTSLYISIAGAAIFLIVLGSLLTMLRKRSRAAGSTI